MKFHLEFAMDNAAFDTDPTVEAAMILRDIAEQVLTSGDTIVRDSNGNRVGEWRIEGDS